MIWIILLAAIATPIAHIGLLNWTPYRWVINSLLYPYHKRYAVKVFGRIPPIIQKSQVIYFINRDSWFKKYWFGRKLDNYLYEKYCL